MKKNDCDGKKCDEKAIPCSFARQVIFAREGTIEDQKEEINRIHVSRFVAGILVSLSILHLHDQPVIAWEIVDACCGIRKLEEAVRMSATEQDYDTLRWLKKSR